MITDKDLADGVTLRWSGEPLLEALVPAARVYSDRVAEGTPWPNARLRIAAEEPQRLGSENYLRAFTLDVLAETLAEGGDFPAIAAALSAAFGGSNADPTAGLTVAGGTVLHCLERTDGTTPRPGRGARRDGDDFLRVAATFDILVQGTF